MGNARRLLTARGNYREYMHFDPDQPGAFIIETVQDCEAVVDKCKVLSDTVPGKDFRHAACVPDFVFAQAMREGWLNDEKKWKAWANNPDNVAFRTWKGRL